MPETHDKLRPLRPLRPNDCHFPLIKYKEGEAPRQWGRQHGEEFRGAIEELATIRRELIIAKNPALGPHLIGLAREQIESSRRFSPLLAEEMEGIAEGAGLPLEELAILNNYTDFRDIEMAEEGCSSVSFRNSDDHISGQTWDMHQSAKDYICLIQCPLPAPAQGEMLLFSLVGCLGMMGVSTHKNFVGVNNINTTHARPALIWPFLVRQLLTSKELPGMQKILQNAPVSSGHNYLISDQNIAEHWEVTPVHCQRISRVSPSSPQAAFHTNHCLDPQVQATENPLAVNSTTRERYQILVSETPKLRRPEDLTALLKSHKGYPKSICSHYSRGAQDPSTTCGGGVFQHHKGAVHLWRGCSREDANYRFRNFKIADERWVEV